MIRKESIARIRTVCRSHHVVSLELFGSAVEADAEKAKDLDFLVEFEHLPPAGHADAFFGLLADLEDLLEKPVDLVELSAISNPYFRQSVLRSKVPLYAAA